MEDHLNRLEAKVNQTIERLQELRRVNADLEQRNRQLEEGAEALRAERDRMQRQLEEAGTAAAQVEQYEEKRRLIEQKVGSLLEKLEAMG